MSKQIAPRTCIVTRETFDSRADDALIRFVLGPEGNIVPDLRRKLPGRGVWVTSGKEFVDQAVKSGAFGRSLKAVVNVDSGLSDLVRALMEQAVLGALGMAKKAGQCTIGSTKVKLAVEQGRTIGLFHAQDGSCDGLNKLEKVIVQSSLDQSVKPKIWRMFESEKLGLALGATNVIHAALLSGHAGRNCFQKAERLRLYCG